MTITTSGSVITFSDSTTQSTAATASPIPSGTVVLFYQSAAPTGWTQVTTLNDYALRIVSGTGGATGGSTAFSTVFANQTPTISVNVSGLSAGATTISTAQMPAHHHPLPYRASSALNAGLQYMTAWSGNACVGNSCGASNGSQCSSSIIGNTGGGGSHTHSISGSATGSSTAVTLNVQYANIIICSKN